MGRFLLLSLFVLALFSGSAPYGAKATLTDNIVTQWNEAAQKVIRDHHIPSEIAARTFATLHVAIFRALRLYDKNATNFPGAQRVPCAIYAAHYVLATLFPHVQSPILDVLISVQLGPYLLTSAQISASKRLGKYHAVAAIRVRIDDGSEDFANFKPGLINALLGGYQYVPGQKYCLYPQLGYTKPFLASPNLFDTNSAPLVGSTEFLADLKEAASLGLLGSTVRLAVQADVALFWEDGPSTCSHACHWFQIAKILLPANSTLDDVAKAYVLIGVAQYDVAIAIFLQKYKYKFWRPITAIRLGVSLFAAIPSWTPFLSTPFSPEYPCGHSGTAGSTAFVLAKILKLTDIYAKIPEFTVLSEGKNGALTPRKFTSLAQVALEIGDSRIYAGVNFRKSVKDGLSVGLKVGAKIWELFPTAY